MEFALCAMAALAALILLAVLYLLVVALLSGFPTPRQKLKPASSSPPGLPPDESPTRVETFSVGGDLVHAWFFLPRDHPGPVPCVVMAHGLGGVKAMGLAYYAARFQRAGLAALVFDYRGYGDSQGEPRELISIPRQTQDWRAAIAHARGLPEVDPKRIALWGSSLSGGHVLVAAARDGRITCLCAQCPSLDNREAVKEQIKRLGVGYMLRLLVHGQRDMVRSWLSLPSHKIPVTAPKGSIALLSDDQAFQAFSRMAPADYVNQACARILLRIDKYRPIKFASRVNCPCLLLVCDHDQIVPPAAAGHAAKALGRKAKLKHYPIGHFDIYFGEYREKSIQDQLDFLSRHLAGPTPS